MRGHSTTSLILLRWERINKLCQVLSSKISVEQRTNTIWKETSNITMSGRDTSTKGMGGGSGGSGAGN